MRRPAACAAGLRRALAAVALMLAATGAHAQAPTRSAPCFEGGGLAFCGAAPAPRAAWFEEPTDRYDHAILGDALEWQTLVFRNRAATYRVTLGPDAVFEDLRPRLSDLDGDGQPEIVVVQTALRTGAQLAVYGLHGNRLTKIAATPHIGTPHRWLAPLGAADLDGDGAVEIAYVDRPHLARTLRIWRYRDGRLAEVAQASGLTNHRIGQDFISGGVRDCGAGPELVVASADWTRLVAVRLRGGRAERRDIGPHEGRNSFAAALSCR